MFVRVSENKLSKICFYKSYTKIPLQLIHSNVVGPMKTNSIGGCRFFVTFIDDFSQFTWVYPMKEKSEVFMHFQHFLAFVENIFGCKLKTLHFDCDIKGL